MAIVGKLEATPTDVQNGAAPLAVVLGALEVEPIVLRIHFNECYGKQTPVQQRTPHGVARIQVRYRV
jgi:hypothetical protein